MQYDANRYAVHLTARELEIRFAELLDNIVLISGGGKIGAGHPEEGPFSELWEKFTHMQREFEIRYGPYPNGLHKGMWIDSSVQKFSRELAERGEELLGNIPRDERYLLKFGKAAHLRDFLHRGRMRLGPARSYADEALIKAVKDDELSIDMSTTVQASQLSSVFKRIDLPPGESSMRLDLRFMTRSDYSIFCLSRSRNARMFFDFDADACVVIHDPDKFLELVAECSMTQMPDADFRHRDVHYVDPILPSEAVIDVPMSKPFGYLYQQEYRLAWVPIEPAEFVDVRWLKLPKLTDIAELKLLV